MMSESGTTTIRYRSGTLKTVFELFKGPEFNQVPLLLYLLMSASHRQAHFIYKDLTFLIQTHDFDFLI